MIFFHQPKPRRFHHEFIYYDERKERLKKMKEYVQAEKEGCKVEKKSEKQGDEYHEISFRTSPNRRQTANHRFMTIVGITTLLTLLIVFLFAYFM